MGKGEELDDGGGGGRVCRDWGGCGDGGGWGCSRDSGVYTDGVGGGGGGGGEGREGEEGVGLLGCCRGGKGGKVEGEGFGLGQLGIPKFAAQKEFLHNCQFGNDFKTFHKLPLPISFDTSHPHHPLISPVLILHRAPHRKLESYPLPRQSPIHLRISIQPIVDIAPLLLIQHHLQYFAPVLPCARPLPHNLNGVYHVSQDGVMHGGQGARVRALLGLRGARAVGAFGAGEDAAGGE